MSLPTKHQRLADEAIGGQLDDQRSLKADNEMLINGFQSIRQRVVGKHPLEALEKTYQQRMDNQGFSLLKSVQGIHAPLRLIHERRAAQHMRRLPGLSSSNLMLDVLTGRDEEIGPQDYLNDVNETLEVMAPIHMLCERQ
ncbi:unnamed protein product [Medioppia subpectinata]|uniref:Proteasome maturation protein n=1 Tax=Medioppia subpectinata TaxID=1979941 RepID=A0A7R9KJ91_9ACAR|nr:unnamed protein product [Medioppia subpectinata]CAG2103348.1 unnamed protein product [Medioppia subpectinata]